MTTIVITGATSGLGQIAAEEFARSGAHLILTARNPDRAARTVAKLRTIAPDVDVEVFAVDLSSTADVARAGEAIAAAHTHIDVLINNAGIHAFEQRVTREGYSEMIAVNYLAPWILTRALLPSLTSARGARIVNVASEASRRHGTLTIPQDLTDTAPFTARESSALYGKSKLFDIMFSLHLAELTRDTGTTVNALDPGFNVTGLGRELKAASAIERVLNALRIGDPRRGAGLIVKLATDPTFDGHTGGYYTVRGTRALTPVFPATDAGLRAELWKATERLLDRDA